MKTAVALSTSETSDTYDINQCHRPSCSELCAAEEILIQKRNINSGKTQDVSFGLVSTYISDTVSKRSGGKLSYTNYSENDTSESQSL